MVRIFDLAERTAKFAIGVRLFVRKLPKTVLSRADGAQVVRSSGSVAANYIEADEALSKKDFLMRIKICRKEAKETILWLRLLEIEIDQSLCQERLLLLREAHELLLIFAAIVRKTESIAH